MAFLSHGATYVNCHANANNRLKTLAGLHYLHLLYTTDSQRDPATAVSPLLACSWKSMAIESFLGEKAGALSFLAIVGVTNVRLP